MRIFCFTLLILILIFNLTGCYDKKITEAYKHIKRARELRDTDVVHQIIDPIQELKEYEIAYQISSKELESWDYERMSYLYLTIRGDEKKVAEFEQKTKEKAKQEGPTRRVFWSKFCP